MSILLFAVGLALVALLTAGVAAVRSVSRIWLRHWVEARLSGGRTAPPSVDGVRKLILAGGTGVALIAFAIGAAVGSSSAESAAGDFERLLVATLLLLVVGQLIPRAIGQRWATQLVDVLMPVLRAVGLVVAPFVALVVRLTHRTRPGVGPTSADGDPHEALEDLLREGELEGVGDAGESAIISGVVEFTEKYARDLMTPRSEVFALDRDLPAAELASRFAEAKYSRIPVVAGSLDHVVGWLHAFDVLKWEFGPAPTLRPVVFANENDVASELLSRMLRERVHLAIVRDGAARTAGLVTLEDLLEELVGDIRDEHDDPPPTGAPT